MLLINSENVSFNKDVFLLNKWSLLPNRELCQSVSCIRSVRLYASRYFGLTFLPVSVRRRVKSHIVLKALFTSAWWNAPWCFDGLAAVAWCALGTRINEILKRCRWKSCRAFPGAFISNCPSPCRPPVPRPPGCLSESIWTPSALQRQKMVLEETAVSHRASK